MYRNVICALLVCSQLLRSSLVNNRTQAKVAEELGMQEFAITNDKTKRPVALRTKTLADLLECMFTDLWFIWWNTKRKRKKNLYRPLKTPTQPFSCMSRQNVQFKTAAWSTIIDFFVPFVLDVKHSHFTAEDTGRRA